MTRRGLTLGSVIAVFVATAAVAAMATATALSQESTTPPGDSDDQNTSRITLAEQQVDDAADSIATFWDLPGFAATGLDYDARSVTVWWVGDLPGEVTRAIAELPADITIIVKQAKTSGDDALTAVESLVESGILDTHGYQFAHGGPNRDYSGIEVYVAPTASASAAARFEEAAQLHHSAGPQSHLPLEIVHVDENQVARPAPGR
ncbi:hypothetical protein [Nocardioides limicola]|uniref:hypothetical protein n=1 Tax=Nocardioides limicola TaxID=2803368 RepID=UPI00193C6EC6|nr:hypothetical protein [Nocardioides sp. DJM-14]